MSTGFRAGSIQANYLPPPHPTKGGLWRLVNNGVLLCNGDGIGGHFFTHRPQAIQLTSHCVRAPILVFGSKPLSLLAHSGRILLSWMRIRRSALGQA